MKELAFLNKGVKINLFDERQLYTYEEGEEDENGNVNTVKIPQPAREPVSYKYDGGLIDFVKYLNGDKNALYAAPLYYSAIKDIQLKGAPLGKIKIGRASCRERV